MGIRYAAAFAKPADLSALPSPARASYGRAAFAFQQRDRGMVCAKSDKALDNKANHFARWLVKVRFNYTTLRALKERHIMPLLVAYLHHIAYEKGGLTSKKDLMATSLRQYLTAACTWIKATLHRPAEIYDSDGKLHPMIADILDERKKWERPKKKREPYTHVMFQILAHQIAAECRKDATMALGLKAAVFEWARLGAFTGSRVAEYAQTHGNRDCVSRVPDNPGAAEWANDPIAFIEEDFTFFSKDGIKMSFSACMRDPSTVEELHIRFRYDKSPRNCVTRKFRRTRQGWFCPVEAGLSIISRFRLLKMDSKQPLGVYKPKSLKNGSFHYLRSYEFIKVMRQSVVDGYPDPNHYMRKNILRVDAHSNRVTAAVALSNVGMTIDEIAFRLRWKPESVDHYLRDCSRAIGRLSEAVIRGSALI